MILFAQRGSRRAILVTEKHSPGSFNPPEPFLPTGTIMVHRKLRHAMLPILLVALATLLLWAFLPVPVPHNTHDPGKLMPIAFPRR